MTVRHLDVARGELAQMLRNLADQVDAQEIESCAITMVHPGGELTTAYGSAGEASDVALLGAVTRLAWRISQDFGPRVPQ